MIDQHQASRDAEIRRRKKRLKLLRKQWHALDAKHTYLVKHSHNKSGQKIVKMWRDHAEQGIDAQLRGLAKLGAA